MELTFIQQSSAFLFSIALGVALGVLYGIIKFFRMLFEFKKAATIALDIIFMLASFISVYFLSLAYLCGYVRIYMYLGCAAGIFAYRLTLGRLISKIYSPIIVFVKKLSQNIYLKFKKITKNLLKSTYNILYNGIIKRRIFGSGNESDVLEQGVVNGSEKPKAKRTKRSYRRKVRKRVD